MSFLLQLLLLLGFPALVALASAYLSWGALRRPWVYLLVSLVVHYTLYSIAFYLFAPQSVGYIVSPVQPGRPPAQEPLLILLEPYVKPMVVFGITALPIVLLLLRFSRKVSSQ